jgi:hypothetical protein
MNLMEEAREVLETEVEARLALRRAKAECFLRWLGAGESVTKVWQRVALDTVDEQARWELANVERLLLWLNAGISPAGIAEPDER